MGGFSLSHSGCCEFAREMEMAKWPRELREGGGKDGGTARARNRNVWRKGRSGKENSTNRMFLSLFRRNLPRMFTARTCGTSEVKHMCICWWTGSHYSCVLMQPNTVRRAASLSPWVHSLTWCLAQSEQSHTAQRCPQSWCCLCWSPPVWQVSHTSSVSTLVIQQRTLATDFKGLWHFLNKG